MHRRPHLRALLAATLVVFASPASPAPQEQANRPVFAADVSMVMVDVSVLDAEGLPVAGLAAEDFRLLEDGAEQQIAVVLRPSEIPADIGLLMDLSGSVREDALELRRDALAFLDALTPEDCVYFLPFSNEVGEGTWGRPDDEALREAVNRSQVRGYTPLYDALLRGIDRVANAAGRCAGPAGESDQPAAPDARPAGRPDERRRAIVVLTDGGDTSSEAVFAAAVNAASIAEVPIFPVAIGSALTEGRAANLGVGEQRRPGTDADVRVRTRGDSGLVEESEAARAFDHTARAIGQSVQERYDARRRAWGLGLAGSLRELADVSGGVYIDGGETATSLRVAYNEILTWLRASYRIGYYPPRRPPMRAEYRGRAEWHTLEVRAVDETLRVFARPGYYQRDIDPVASAAALQAGIEMLRQNLATEAMVAFSEALAADPYNWEAHYYRGRAFGVQGMFADARDDFLAAARLGPGIGAVHEFAAIASADAGDYATAWEHALRAEQAGDDVSQRIEALRAASPPPADFDRRRTAPLLYVGRAVVPDPEAQALIEAVGRSLRLAISESRDFGLVAESPRADYFVVVQVDDIDTDGLGSIGGVLEAWVPGGERVHDRGFAIEEVFNEDLAAGVLADLLAELADRLARR